MGKEINRNKKRNRYRLVVLSILGVIHLLLINYVNTKHRRNYERIKRNNLLINRLFL